MLTEPQKHHFDTFGFLVLPGLLTRGEVDIIKRESGEIYEQVFGGNPSEATERMALQPFFERRPFMAALVDDDRIYAIGEDLLGPDFVLDGTEGNFHVGDTRWHGGNGAPLTVRSTKIAFYVEALTKDTGCLRFIPGSHHPEYGKHLEVIKRQFDDPSTKPFGVSGPDMHCVAIETQPGDVVVFMENTFHAAFGGQPGRQQHAISFIENPRTPEQIAWTRAFYDRARYSFHPSESYINSDRPRIRRMVARLIELGFEALPY